MGWKTVVLSFTSLMRYHGHGVKSDLCGTVTFYLGVSFGLWVDKS